jgi:hypothetical protein
MDETTKDRLEALQAEIKLETGRKVTQQELLDRLVSHAFESKAAFVDSFRDEGVALDESEVRAFLGETSDWGVETTEAEIDEVLYDEASVEQEK